MWNIMFMVFMVFMAGKSVEAAPAVVATETDAAGFSAMLAAETPTRGGIGHFMG